MLTPLLPSRKHCHYCKGSQPPWHLLSLPPSPSPGQLLVRFLFLGISQFWTLHVNGITKRGRQCLTSFVWCDVLKAHLHCRMYQHYILFSDWPGLHCMNPPRSVFPFIPRWTVRLFPPLTVANSAVLTPAVFSCTQGPLTQFGSQGGAFGCS